MEKDPTFVDGSGARRHRNWRLKVSLGAAAGACLAFASCSGLVHDVALRHMHPSCRASQNLEGDLDGDEPNPHSPYGSFPRPDDPFRFLPCTNASIPPPLDDADPERTWAQLFDPNPDHWSWGNKTADFAAAPPENEDQESTDSSTRDPYAGRGIYLCGYLDVPLDYTNASDPRIARLAVTKFQVSGLSLVATNHRVESSSTGQPGPKPAGSKSERTIVIEPGGPGGSGTLFAWREAEAITRRLSAGAFDVLGWDPRGVNASQPAAACFPRDAHRDRWQLLTGQYREEAAAAVGSQDDDDAGPRAQLLRADAMHAAVFRACRERLGDLGRFVSTAFVARDLERLRAALGEAELTGYLVSYGTGIGQTYANMFPDRVGRLVLDGPEYVRDHRLLGGFGWTALDNATDAWRDGFLGECVRAGPAHCALVEPKKKQQPDSEHPSPSPPPVSVGELETRMVALLTSLIAQPVPAYTEASGPSLVTYSGLVHVIYESLYKAASWPRLATLLRDLEQGNATLAAAALDEATWEDDPARGFPAVLTSELGNLVICADAYDAPPPADGLEWWLGLWANMTATSWVAGNDRFFTVLPCRHFTAHWPEPAEVYRGNLNHTLKHPVLLIAETHDPATPLRNGRRLLREMGPGNARLIVHHGYGHSSRDRSN